MDEVKPIEERYDGYVWGERYPMLTRISTALTIAGWAFLLLGVVTAGAVLLQRVPLVLASNVRLPVAGIALLIGILFCLSFLAASHALGVLVAIEKNTRCSANIWRILEERDLME
jgi:hypothetical protein